MKKILLLLMAILLFAPPKAEAQSNSITVWDQSKAIPSTTTILTKKYSGGAFTNASAGFIAFTGTASYTSYTTALPWYVRAIDNTQKNGAIISFPKSSSSKNVTFTGANVTGTSRYFNIPGGYTMTVEVAYGEIDHVDMDVYYPTGINSVYMLGEDGTKVTTKANGSITVSGSPTTLYTLTLTNPTGGVITFAPGSNQSNTYVGKIVVYIKDGTADTPTAPKLSVKANSEYGYILDEDGKTLKAPHNYGVANKAATLNSSSQFIDLYYTFRKDLAENTVAGGNYATSWKVNTTAASFTDTSTGGVSYYGAKLYLSGEGIRFEGVMPAPADLGTGKGTDTHYTMYYFGKDLITNEFTPVQTLDVSWYRYDDPDIDIEKTKANNKTATITSYDPETRTLRYTGYSPNIYFKNPTGLGKYTFKYSTDFVTHPSSSAGTTLNYQTTAPTTELSPVSLKTGSEDMLPVNGRTEVIELMAYKANSDKCTGKTYAYPTTGYYTFTIISENPGGEQGGGEVKFIDAPRVSTTAKVVNLQGDVRGFITASIPVSIISLQGWEEGETAGALQYQWADAADGTWTLQPDETKWEEVENGKYTVTGTGRLFVREFKEGYESRTAYYDFNKLETTKVKSLDYNTILGLDDASTAITIDVPVRLIGSFSLSGENSTTAGNNVYLMFFADKDGNVIRVHNESAGDNPYPYNEENKYKMFKNLTGVLRKNKEMPELFLNTPSLDYSVFIDGPYAAADLKEELGENYPSYEPVLTDKVPVVSDYSKLMYFGPMRWNQKTGEFTDNYDGSVKLYDRIETEIGEVSKLEERLADGVQYRIAGYVGYADGALVIMPRAIVAAPRLLAPNPVNPDAAPDQLIDMNVISDNLIISVNTEGLSDNAKLIFVKVPDVEAWLDDNGKFDPAKVDWTNQEERDIMAAAADNANANEIEITAEDLGGDGDCALAVKLSNEGFESALVAVNFIKHDATSVNSIEDFKNEVIKLVSGDDKKYDGFDALPLNTDDAAEHDYYRFDGLARVREVTPHYLYIRTTPGDGSNLPDDADLSAHSMLLYNKDGWDHPVAGIKLEASATDTPVAPQAETEATTPEVTSAPAPIKAGDVITNFALIPTKSKFGNLIGYTTGFARTFRRVDNAEGGSNDPMEKNVQDKENFTPFAEGDRMLRYTVKNAKVGRNVVDATKPDTDPTKFQYYIDMTGKPVINVRDVFEPVNGWDMAWDPEAYYDLTGVVMLADGSKATDEDGRYMLALINYSMPEVSVAEAPTIRLEGAGTDTQELTFLTSADVRLFSSETAQDAYTVYYTTDGSDPLTSETVEIYENGKPFKVSASTTIKAFVVAKGHPNSEVVEFNLTRLASDRRYIVDFVNNTAAETPYRVTATAKVVAKGGEYAFVRGTQGHYLPIHFEDADAKAEAAKLNVGDYINDFVAEPYMVKGDVVRGAHVHGEYAALFKGAVAKPENIDEITAEPDVVDNITAANARRYVKIMNVSLEGEAFEDEEINAVASTQWTCITEKGEGQKIEINHTVLEPSFDWDSSDNDPAACYNITGFAMIGDDGDIELWPTEVEKVKTSVRVTASFTGGGLDKQPVIDADNAYTVNFKKHVTVRLNAVAGATIYYYVSDTDDAVNNPAANAKWNVYAQPFTIARNCYIHAYSVAPGYEESAHTHIYMTLVEDAEEPTTPVTPDPAKMSGKLVISHTFNENNIPVVT
ncbi:MAG: chitobiase/beta-hexosaminidase C-terminal domain-containing protein, partial [Paramuribaculum sp.]|nr:chitobiase/beta-hexosaminidase C-terminal domain-containing protein [Paramuribaculum sp.]